MLISESWLRQFINPSLTTEQLVDTLTMGGLEVEDAAPAAPAFTGVVIGKVLTCVPHENSDHLHVCTVDAGTGEILQIVCGAPNVAAGVKAPCALIGAELPGGFRIKKSKLRGVASFGMLCSARELGVSQDHDGIWLLPEDAPVGEDIRRYANLDDSVIEVKLTPNRGDALSVLGIARDLHAMTGAELRVPSFEPVPATCGCRMPVRIEAPDLCGRFCGRVIRGLNPKAPTPVWMRERLERCGMRSISALVDISNYVMLELGRPTHVFDLAKIEGPVTVRWAREGEAIKLLSGADVTLDPWFGVVADAHAAQAVGGIMGGDAAAVSDTTTDVFLEAAFWWPEAIQGRCRRLNFSTDAAYRFERGVDWASNAAHLERMTRLILEICGTPDTRVGPLDDTVAKLPERRVVRMRPQRCDRLIGIEIPRDFMAQAFSRLGFEFVREGEDFVVTVPSWRFDIEYEADLVEEVARLYGYEKLPDRAPLDHLVQRCAPEGTRGRHALRFALVDRGYQELVNFSFVQEKWEKDFAGNDSPIRLLNPIAAPLSVMRTQLVGGLVDILRYNLHRKADNVRLFEVGRVFLADDSVEDTEWSVKGIRQPVHVAGLAYGDAHGEQWGEKARAVDFYDVKGDVEALAAPLRLQFRAAAHPGLHPGRSAEILLDGKPVGFLGELHPALCREYELPKAPVVFEIDADALAAVPVPSARPVSKFQPVQRDISVTAPAALPVQEIFDAVEKFRSANRLGALIEDFRLFDVYRPQGETREKSLAFRIVLNSMGEEAVGDVQADAAVQAVLGLLEPLGVRLRS